MPTIPDFSPRRLDWDGCYNVRDLGGLPMASGGETRWHAIVRMDTPERLTPAGQQALWDYGVRTIIDLRGRHETVKWPSPYAENNPGQPAYHNLPLESYAPEVGALINQASSRGEVYTIILDHYPHLMAEVLRTIATAPPGTIAIHCHNGMDRTGMVSGLLLSLVGVPPELIAADYATSQVWLQRLYALEAAPPTEGDTRSFWERPTATADMMAHMLAHLDTTYGGAAAYMRQAGLAPEEIELLTKRLALSPTPYPAVNDLLQLLLAEVRGVLHGRFLGLYLYGSLSSGDFNPLTSDVDFVVVTDGDLPDDTIAALEAMHMRLAGSGLKYAAKLEGAYLPQATLRRYDPADAPRPMLNEGSFFMAQLGADWAIQRHILREHGVVVAGPEIRPFIDSVPPAALRQAVHDTLHAWWVPLADAPERLQRPDYQAFAILSMCRALHTLTTGTIASKPTAAAWAKTHLPSRWTPIIDAALTWQPGQPLDLVDACIELIRHTVARSADSVERSA